MEVSAITDSEGQFTRTARGYWQAERGSLMKRLLPLALFLRLSLPALGQQPASFHSLEVTFRTPPERHSVTLTWSPADCQDANVHTIPCPSTPAYAIYRSSTKGGGETCVNGPCYGYCCRIAYTDKGALIYTDSNLGPGQTWYYVVTTVLPPCPAKINSAAPPCGESAVSTEVQAVTPGTQKKLKKKGWF